MCWLEVSMHCDFMSMNQLEKGFLVQLHDNSCFACHRKNKSSVLHGLILCNLCNLNAFCVREYLNTCFGYSSKGFCGHFLSSLFYYI